MAGEVPAANQEYTVHPEVAKVHTLVYTLHNMVYPYTDPSHYTVIHTCVHRYRYYPVPILLMLGYTPAQSH